VTLADWAEEHNVLLEFIKPGRPMQNVWLKEYNEERPHKSLGHLTPREYLLTKKPEISSNSWV
jgi:putative transposase